MSEMVEKYQVVVCNKERNKLLFVKSFYSLNDAQNFYRNELYKKYPKTEYYVYYAKYRTAE